MEDIEKESISTLEKESVETAMNDTNLVITKWQKMNLHPIYCITTMMAVAIGRLKGAEDAGYIDIENVLSSAKDLAKILIEQGMVIKEGEANE